MFDKVNFTGLRNAVREEGSKFLAECRQQSPDATLYGIGLCPDEDVQSLYMMANSEQAQGHPGDRYLVTEWEFNNDNPASADEALADLWERYNQATASMPETIQQTAYSEFRKRCLSAIVDGLRYLRTSEGLPDDFALLIDIPDPDDPEEIVELNKQLNSDSVFQTFRENYMYG